MGWTGQADERLGLIHAQKGNIPIFISLLLAIVHSRYLLCIPLSVPMFIMHPRSDTAVLPPAGQHSANSVHSISGLQRRAEEGVLRLVAVRRGLC